VSLVEIGVPISSSEAEGRNKADVVGTKLEMVFLKIVHV
jgi:hypothetical protein